MPTLRAQWALLALGSFLMACGHAPTLAVTATAPAEAIEWRTSSGRDGLRLAYVIANSPEGAPTGSWPRRLLSWVSGREEARGDAASLQRPFDVVALQDGGYAVADPDAGRVVRFDPRGAFVGDASCGNEPWEAPIALAEPAPGTLLVLDGAAAKLVRWTASGCTTFAARLDRPTGIASHGGSTYVADAGARAIVILAEDGRELARWDSSAPEFGLLQPSEVAVAPDGTVWVVDGLGAKVAHLSANGKPLDSVGQAASPAELARPKGIHVDLSNRVFISDAQRDQVLVFGPAGELQLTLGGAGDGPGQFAHPAGIGGAGDRIVVADSLNRRLQVFEVIGASP